MSTTLVWAIARVGVKSSIRAVIRFVHINDPPGY